MAVPVPFEDPIRHAALTGTTPVGVDTPRIAMVDSRYTRGV